MDVGLRQRSKLRFLEFGVGCHGPVHTWKIARKVSDSPEYYVGIISGRRPSPNRPVTCRHAWLILLKSGRNDTEMSGKHPDSTGTSSNHLEWDVTVHCTFEKSPEVSDSRECYVGIVSGRHPSPNLVVMHEWFYPRCSYIMMQSLSFAK